MPEIFFSCFNKKYFDYFLTLIISGIIFWVVNFFGLGYTYDSHLYVEIAKEINSKSFFLVEGFNIKPPVLPMVISLIGENNMVWVNFFCFLSIQFFGVFWSQRIEDKLLRYLFLIIVVFATPHILINSFLWTEPIFLTTVLSIFYLLDKFYQTEHLKFVASAIFLITLLPFIRFAGIFLIFPLIGFLLFSSKSRRIVFISFFVLLLLSTVWVHMFREGFSGRWERFTHPFLSGRFSHLEFNLTSYLKALGSWFFPYSIDGVVTRVLSVIILLIVIYKSSKHYFIKHGSILFLAPLLFFVYFFLMMFVFKVEYYAAERYLSIFYLLIILNVFIHLNYLIKSTESAYLKKGVYFTILIFALYSFLRTIKNIYFWYNLRSDSFTIDSVDNISSMVL